MTVCLTCGEDPCGQHARCRPEVIGFDLSDGVETHVEGFWKDGVLHVTDRYEIIDHELEGLRMGVDELERYAAEVEAEAIRARRAATLLRAATNDTSNRSYPFWIHFFRPRFT